MFDYPKLKKNVRMNGKHIKETAQQRLDHT